ncbi:MAG: UvrB/UvrC motif-containing protein [Candidatus Moraniibacteriota bacterium]
MSKKPWEKSVSLKRFQADNPLPETPGIYFFLGEKEEILYIGKATVLADRVASYFKEDIVEARGPKIMLMLERVCSIAWQSYDSVLEALLREGELIRRYQPHHNTDAKDDKSHNLIIITKEKFPRVLLIRERDLLQKKFDFTVDIQYGPYPQGNAPKTALKIIRQMFPFRDKCVPFVSLSEKDRAKAKPCFHAQIGLCPGVCVGEVSVTEYRKTINRIKLFFAGEKTALVKKVEREMHMAARRLEFERAGELKHLLFELGHIRDVALLKADQEETSAARLEAYDVAHLQGEASVGVMTVVQHGIVKKSEYRMFRLREKHNGNDLTALEEILTRRFAHSEWPYPELLIVDGALLQYDVAERILRKKGLTLPIVGVVKNKKHQADRIIGPRGLARRFGKDIYLANAEAHRFAIGFHRKRKRREFLEG